MIHRTSNLQTGKSVGVKQPIKTTTVADSKTRAGTTTTAKTNAYDGQENRNYNKLNTYVTSNSSYGAKEVLKPSTASNTRATETISKVQQQKPTTSKNLQREPFGVQEKPKTQTGTRGFTSTKTTQGYNADQRPISQSKNRNNYASIEDDRPLPTQKREFKDPFGTDAMASKSDVQNMRLIECPEGCGRSFNEVALSKHVKVCKKVFQQKRKVFDSQAARKTEEQILLERQARKGTKQPTMGKFGTQQMSAPFKTNQKQQPKWKKESEALRAGLRAARGAKLTKSEQLALQSGQQNDDLIPCDYCGRKFNEKAATKHIPFCANKNKMAQVKAGSKPTTSTKPTTTSSSKTMISKPSSVQGRRYY